MHTENMNTTRTHYERVTFKPEGAKRSRTILLQVTGESAWVLIGVEVDREGDEVSGKGFDERKHIIDKTLISNRAPLRMDLTYGELVDEPYTAR